MSKGEKLFRFLTCLALEKFYGVVTIRFESGKVTHIETETRRMWQYQELPTAAADEPECSTREGADAVVSK